MVGLWSWIWGRSEDDTAMSVAAVASYVHPPGGYGVDWTGDKYLGGYGETKDYTPDYWTLRARSAQLYRDNLYAKGLINRLITNVINVGLTLEATPDEEVIGLPPDSLADWSETVENRFGVYAKTPLLCDYLGVSSFGTLQKKAEVEAFVNGDVLCVLHQAPGSGVPQLQLVSGGDVRSPMQDNTGGNEIRHGVELDSRGRHVAYHVDQKDGTSLRVPAWGPKSGRRIAWLMYGNNTRLDEVRGEPLLSIMLQRAKQIDRYADAAIDKAGLNSILAMTVQKNQDKLSTLSMGNASTRKGSVAVTDGDGTERTVEMNAFGRPGLILQTLAPGEQLVPHSTAGTDVNFAPFEAVMLNSIAWSYEIPPEILTLSFASNYSASMAAINEFKMFLNVKRTEFGEGLPQIIYTEWFISEVLAQRVAAPGFLEAWQDPSKYDVYGAWLLTDWSGAIKPSTDVMKQANGYKVQVENGWITNARASRELNGMKFTKVMKQLRKENELKAAAARSLLELEQEFGTQETNAAMRVVGDIAARVEAIAEGALEYGESSYDGYAGGRMD